MNRTFLWLSVSLVACSEPAVGNDAGSLDGAMTADAAVVADASAAVDGGLLTARALCEGILACVPSFDVEACVRTGQPELDRVSMLGCGDEANGANACTLSIYRPDAMGTCMPDTFDCDAPYRAYNACVIEATGIGEFSCDARSANGSCTTYAGSAQSAEATCSTLSATAIASCPTESAAGRCARQVAGGVTTTTTYYTPLPSGLTVMTLQRICENATGGPAGVWTTF